ncbi:uncharacterized protein XB22065601.L isoform X2 [Xenopus laevis]|uniref:Uncharacterized protein XB22065601.L isoform X2 n=2 Tax=Xenopus laevis TaxID=8355 RepID=A0A1L8FUS3_XENLA|nr:uncharacterized protein XB22065601.L isoform X2 [Xenopus laevis]OCT75325.1 hypothetical protein XELAEV_18030504mg [Xenopus laevis]
MMPQCLANGCRNGTERTDPSLTFHNFPAEVEAAKRWAGLCGITGPDLTNLLRDVAQGNSGKYQLCSLHFEDGFLNGNDSRGMDPGLRQGAEPTLLLGNPPNLQERKGQDTVASAQQLSEVACEPKKTSPCVCHCTTHTTVHSSEPGMNQIVLNFLENSNKLIVDNVPSELASQSQGVCPGSRHVAKQIVLIFLGHPSQSANQTPQSSSQEPLPTVSTSTQTVLTGRNWEPPNPQPDTVKESIPRPSKDLPQTVSSCTQTESCVFLQPDGENQQKPFRRQKEGAGDPTHHPEGHSPHCLMPQLNQYIDSLLHQQNVSIHPSEHHNVSASTSQCSCLHSQPPVKQIVLNFLDPESRTLQQEVPNHHASVSSQTPCSTERQTYAQNLSPIHTKFNDPPQPLCTKGQQVNSQQEVFTSTNPNDAAQADCIIEQLRDTQHGGFSSTSVSPPDCSRQEDMDTQQESLGAANISDLSLSVSSKHENMDAQQKVFGPANPSASYQPVCSRPEEMDTQQESVGPTSHSDLFNTSFSSHQHVGPVQDFFKPTNPEASLFFLSKDHHPDKELDLSRSPLLRESSQQLSIRPQTMDTQQEGFGHTSNSDSCQSMCCKDQAMDTQQEVTMTTINNGSQQNYANDVVPSGSSQPVSIKHKHWDKQEKLENISVLGQDVPSAPKDLSNTRDCSSALDLAQAEYHPTEHNGDDGHVTNDVSKSDISRINTLHNVPAPITLSDTCSSVCSTPLQSDAKQMPISCPPIYRHQPQPSSPSQQYPGNKQESKALPPDHLKCEDTDTQQVSSSQNDFHSTSSRSSSQTNGSLWTDKVSDFSQPASSTQRILIALQEAINSDSHEHLPQLEISKHQITDTPLATINPSSAGDLPPPSVPKQQIPDTPLVTISPSASEDLPLPSVTKQQIPDTPLATISPSSTEELPPPSVPKQQIPDTPMTTISPSSNEDLPLPSAPKHLIPDTLLATISQSSTKEVPLPSVSKQQIPDTPLAANSSASPGDLPLPSISKHQNTDTPLDSTNDNSLGDLLQVAASNHQSTATLDVSLDMGSSSCSGDLSQLESSNHQNVDAPHDTDISNVCGTLSHCSSSLQSSNGLQEVLLTRQQYGDTPQGTISTESNSVSLQLTENIGFTSVEGLPKFNTTEEFQDAASSSSLKDPSLSACAGREHMGTPEDLLTQDGLSQIECPKDQPTDPKQADPNACSPTPSFYAERASNQYSDLHHDVLCSRSSGELAQSVTTSHSNSDVLQDEIYLCSRSKVPQTDCCKLDIAYNLCCVSPQPSSLKRKHPDFSPSCDQSTCTCSVYEHKGTPEPDIISGDAVDSSQSVNTDIQCIVPEISSGCDLLQDVSVSSAFTCCQLQKRDSYGDAPGHSDLSTNPTKAAHEDVPDPNTPHNVSTSACSAQESTGAEQYIPENDKVSSQPESSIYQMTETQQDVIYSTPSGSSQSDCSKHQHTGTQDPTLSNDLIDSSQSDCSKYQQRDTQQEPPLSSTIGGSSQSDCSKHQHTDSQEEHSLSHTSSVPSQSDCSKFQHTDTQEETSLTHTSSVPSQSDCSKFQHTDTQKEPSLTHTSSVPSQSDCSKFQHTDTQEETSLTHTSSVPSQSDCSKFQHTDTQEETSLTHTSSVPSQTNCSKFQHTDTQEETSLTHTSSVPSQADCPKFKHIDSQEEPSLTHTSSVPSQSDCSKYQHTDTQEDTSLTHTSSVPSQSDCSKFQHTDTQEELSFTHTSSVPSQSDCSKFQHTNIQDHSLSSPASVSSQPECSRSHNTDTQLDAPMSSECSTYQHTPIQVVLPLSGLPSDTSKPQNSTCCNKDTQNDLPLSPIPLVLSKTECSTLTHTKPDPPIPNAPSDSAEYQNTDTQQDIPLSASDSSECSRCYNAEKQYDVPRSSTTIDSAHLEHSRCDNAEKQYDVPSSSTTSDSTSLERCNAEKRQNAPLARSPSDVSQLAISCNQNLSSQQEISISRTPSASSQPEYPRHQNTDTHLELPFTNPPTDSSLAIITDYPKRDTQKEASENISEKRGPVYHHAEMQQNSIGTAFSTDSWENNNFRYQDRDTNVHGYDSGEVLEPSCSEGQGPPLTKKADVLVQSKCPTYQQEACDSNTTFNSSQTPELGQKMGAQDPVTFDDISVYFSRDEWALLDAGQKQLYREVMAENYRALVSVGYVMEEPGLVSHIEHEQQGSPIRSRSSLHAGRHCGFIKKTHNDVSFLSVQDAARPVCDPGPTKSSNHLCALMRLVKEIPGFLLGSSGSPSPAESLEEPENKGPSPTVKTEDSSPSCTPTPIILQHKREAQLAAANRAKNMEPTYTEVITKEEEETFQTDSGASTKLVRPSGKSPIRLCGDLAGRIVFGELNVKQEECEPCTPAPHFPEGKKETSAQKPKSFHPPRNSPQAAGSHRANMAAAAQRSLGEPLGARSAASGSEVRIKQEDSGNGEKALDPCVRNPSGLPSPHFEALLHQDSDPRRFGSSPRRSPADNMPLGNSHLHGLVNCLKEISVCRPRLIHNPISAVRLGPELNRICSDGAGALVSRGAEAQAQHSHFTRATANSPSQPMPEGYNTRLGRDETSRSSLQTFERGQEKNLLLVSSPHRLGTVGSRRGEEICSPDLGLKRTHSDDLSGLLGAISSTKRAALGSSSPSFPVTWSSPARRNILKPPEEAPPARCDESPAWKSHLMSVMKCVKKIPTCKPSPSTTHCGSPRFPTSSRGPTRPEMDLSRASAQGANTEGKQKVSHVLVKEEKEQSPSWPAGTMWVQPDSSSRDTDKAGPSGKNIHLSGLMKLMEGIPGCDSSGPSRSMYSIAVGQTDGRKPGRSTQLPYCNDDGCFLPELSDNTIASVDSVFSDDTSLSSENGPTCQTQLSERRGARRDVPERSRCAAENGEASLAAISGLQKVVRGFLEQECTSPLSAVQREGSAEKNRIQEENGEVATYLQTPLPAWRGAFLCHNDKWPPGNDSSYSALSGLQKVVNGFSELDCVSPFSAVSTTTSEGGTDTSTNKKGEQQVRAHSSYSALSGLQKVVNGVVDIGCLSPFTTTSNVSSDGGQDTSLKKRCDDSSQVSPRPSGEKQILLPPRAPAAKCDPGKTSSAHSSPRLKPTPRSHCIDLTQEEEPVPNKTSALIPERQERSAPRRPVELPRVPPSSSQYIDLTREDEPLNKLKSFNPPAGGATSSHSASINKATHSEKRPRPCIDLTRERRVDVNKPLDPGQSGQEHKRMRAGVPVVNEHLSGLEKLLKDVPAFTPSNQPSGYRQNATWWFKSTSSHET